MAYLRRLAEATLDALLPEVPAVLVAGPRAAGKTTTARRYCIDVARLDRPAEAAAARLDPDAFLAGAREPLLIDEWQQVPEIMGGLKRAIDDREGHHRFLVTGSSRADLGPLGWPATGRLVRVPMWGLSMREMVGSAVGASIVDLLAVGAPLECALPAEVPDLREYIEIALRGGLPEVALSASGSVRARRLASYVDEMVRREAGFSSDRKDPRLLRRYLEAIAANTAGIVEHKTLFDAAQTTRVTAVTYDSLLELLYVTEQVPAWHSGKLKRIAHAPKRYLVDPALMGPLLDLDARLFMRNADLLGRLVDTLVVSQLRPELDVAKKRFSMAHLRVNSGQHEVDLMLTNPRGDVIAIEIKATSAPQVEDAKHLIWLREQLGTSFRCGVVFHTGPRPFRLATDIYALPICCIWGQHPVVGADR